jgi:ribosomal protein S18 acetylase RimI-like enzyme
VNLAIRSLTVADVPDADRVVCAAFRATESRITEIHRYIKLQPDGWFAAQVDGKLVGTVGAVIFNSFAYLGMMAVDPTMHRQGIARKLMQHVLAWLESRRCKIVLLDASQYGAPLYTSLGFIPEGQAVVFENTEPQYFTELPQDISALREHDLPALAQFDMPIFGASRTKVLETYLADFPNGAFVARDNDDKISGFVFVQLHRIGPWVARDIQTAEKLLRAAFIVAQGQHTTVIVPAANTNASQLLEQYGFQFLRSQTHMRLGSAYPVRQREFIFGQASFTLG